jgi:hypothetical protein
MSSINERRPLLAATVLMPMLSAVGCSSTGSPSNPRSYIAEKSRLWTACFSSGEPTVMEEILATDFVGTSPGGKRSSKAESIQSAREGPRIFAKTQLDKIEVHLISETAIALGEDVLDLKAGSQVRTAWTDTWVHREGRWQAVASHESVVKNPSSM